MSTRRARKRIRAQREHSAGVQRQKADAAAARLLADDPEFREQVLRGLGNIGRAFAYGIGGISAQVAAMLSSPLPLATPEGLELSAMRAAVQRIEGVALAEVRVALAEVRVDEPDAGTTQRAAVTYRARSVPLPHHIDLDLGGLDLGEGVRPMLGPAQPGGQQAGCDPLPTPGGAPNQDLPEKRPGDIAVGGTDPAAGPAPRLGDPARAVEGERAASARPGPEDAR